MNFTLRRHMATVLSGMGMICITVICAGCEVDTAGRYMTDVRKENGLVIILPGIEGESEFNHNIRRGLVSAGSYRAMPIYNWGRPIPGLGMLLNQMDVLGNRAAGKRIAQMIEQYEDAYPGRPVYIIGHSGGGGVAVFAAEELSKEYKIDGLVLLAASISDGYNLTKALNNCRNGIVNFYNPSDGGLLGVGTTLMGNVDGARGAAAGLNGFIKQPNKLYQIKVTDSMTAASGGGSHDAATRPRFVATYVAPWVLSSRWPPAATTTNYNPYR